MSPQPVNPSRISSATPAFPAAGLSLACGILWPLSLVAQIVVGILDQHQLPAWLAAVTVLVLLLAPPVGIVAGHVALHRSRQLWLHHTRTRTIVALVANYLWLVSLFLVSDLGAALVVWVRSW